MLYGVVFSCRGRGHRCRGTSESAASLQPEPSLPPSRTRTVTVTVL
jgi:hypothetical protein